MLDNRAEDLPHQKRQSSLGMGEGRKDMLCKLQCSTGIFNTVWMEPLHDDIGNQSVDVKKPTAC